MAVGVGWWEIHETPAGLSRSERGKGLGGRAHGSGRTLHTVSPHTSVEIPEEAQGKLRQQHRWGTDEWIRDYARRTYVEGSFGELRNPALAVTEDDDWAFEEIDPNAGGGGTDPPTATTPT